jgi:asparagine synthase (glutamine-hydrolysing)
MCGIVGVIGHNSKSFQCEKMLEIQSHRGPDYAGKYYDNKCFLGHNRLSIIDLTEGANQPMSDQSNRYVIVFNGEIYNYLELKEQLKKEFTFVTNSDTEVLLLAYHKWGSAMLEKLNGMFAFAIWDKLEGKLFAARDRFGVKPFYFAFKDDHLLFSSEIKALWAAGVPKVKNEKVWAGFLVNASYGMPNETFWDGIYQLPGGCMFEMNAMNITNDLAVSKWYDFASRIMEMPENTIDSFKDLYQTLLKESVELRFRADVSVAFNISGGLDSSTLLSMVNQLYPGNSNINAYTFLTGHPDYDETPWVRKMISLTKNPLNECLLTADEVEQRALKVSYHQDEPFGGLPTVAYSKIFEIARNQGSIVLLDGQGMDEAWAGYDYYVTGSGYKIQGMKSSPVRPEVLMPEFRDLALDENYATPFSDSLLNLQYRDLFYTKIPRALRFNDRISMMYSTELREPFLDYRLVELAFAQPLEVKIRDGQRKWMLREISREFLGSEIAYAPKRPLQTPQREWLACELKDFTIDSVNLFSNQPWVNKKALQKLVDDYFKGNNDNSFYLWQWINLGLLL